MTDERKAEDRRTGPRRRTLKSAVLVINNGFSTMDCTLRDISEGGARVQTDNALRVPNDVKLVIGDGVEHKAVVLRRSPRDVVLKFVS